MITAILENHSVDPQGSWWQGLYYARRWMRDQVGEEHLPEEFFQLDTDGAWFEFQPAVRETKTFIKQAELSHLYKVRRDILNCGATCSERRVRRWMTIQKLFL